MFVMRMRISLDLIFSIWTGDKKHNGMKKYLLHSVHMKVNHVVFFNHFVQKRKLTLPQWERDAFQLLYVAYVNAPWQGTPWEAIVTLSKRYRAVVWLGCDWCD